MILTDNTLFITGGGSGIGRALAEAFHRRGNKVIIAGRRASALDETLQANPGMCGVTLDIENPVSIRETADRLARDHPALNVIIHNAGIMRPERLTEPESSVADAEAMVATNLLGPIRLNAAILPLLRKQTQAAVLTVSSGLAFVPGAGFPSYCATKAAIHSYTQSLRYQLRGTAIQVIELIPPYVRTGLTGSRQAADPHAMALEEYIEETLRLLETESNAGEITVERVERLRRAEQRGEYDSVYSQLNAWQAERERKS